MRVGVICAGSRGVWASRPIPGRYRTETHSVPWGKVLLVRAPEDSLIPLPDQVRQAGVDAVIIPSPEHLDALTLNSIMSVAPVESAYPRLSFVRWIDVDPGAVR